MGVDLQKTEKATAKLGIPSLSLSLQPRQFGKLPVRCWRGTGHGGRLWGWPRRESFPVGAGPGVDGVAATLTRLLEGRPSVEPDL